MKKISKVKHQIKSNKYYLFWGAATISVIFGQIYVGNGFRRMADTHDAISADINLLIENIMYAVPQQREYHSDSMVIR
tara:strand:+ start:235 stop:468 length:234 start_codon:yes stop_codon:yes gene_type:complete